jgi:hypothetical protein
VSTGHKSRTRKHRRLGKARLRTGKTIAPHTLPSGRTGTLHHKRRQSLHDRAELMAAREPKEEK